MFCQARQMGDGIAIERVLVLLWSGTEGDVQVVLVQEDDIE